MLGIRNYISASEQNPVLGGRPSALTGCVKRKRERREGRGDVLGHSARESFYLSIVLSHVPWMTQGHRVFRMSTVC